MTAAALKRWLEIRPRNAITVLDTHDGIGVVDVDAARGSGARGLLTRDEIDTVVKTIHQRSRGESRIASGSAASNVDSSQINCTFYDALGRRDSDYLIARAIQCFAPGIPQVYYVGLLAGCNDMELLRRTGVGRDINRHYYTADELRQELTRPVVQSLLALLRFRNTHPAFQGTFEALESAADSIALVWTNGDDVRSPGCELHRDVRIDHVLGSRSTVRSRRSMAGGRRGTSMTGATTTSRNMAVVKTLTYLMFAMFAMTTDSVGVIIPEIIKTFQLSLTAAGTFQYATMTGIALAGLMLGQLADRVGRRPTIVIGLTLFAAACFLLAAGKTFLFFAVMLGVSGLAIGVFKTGALALIGDISTSTAQHTSIMNTVEGFFGVGAIIGPAILTRLLAAGMSWTWLYVIAGTICVVADRARARW